MNAFDNASFFLISTLFDLAIFLFLIRLILVAVGADFYNPVSQFVNNLTQFIIVPMRRKLRNINRLETASVIVVIVLEILKFMLLGLLVVGRFDILGILVLACADILKSVLNIFFYAILAQAILTWIQGYSPVVVMLAKITSPIMRPLQRVIPPVGAIDITPIPAMILLQLCTIIFATPLFIAGQRMAFG